MSEILDMMKRRHSVRQYRNEPLTDDEIFKLTSEIEDINKTYGTHIQLVTGEPRAFDTRIAKYGKFEGVSNYIALVGTKCKELFEKLGYLGERLVLFAHQNGLQSCWVGIGFNKVLDAVKVEKGERFVLVIAIGHGRHRGLPRKSKAPEAVSNISETSPEWFSLGVRAALTAPTAMNQQKFYFTDNGDGTVSAKARLAPYGRVDLGIAKYHFELAAGKENFSFV